MHKIIRTLEYFKSTKLKIKKSTERVIELLRINYSKSMIGAYVVSVGARSLRLFTHSFTPLSIHITKRQSLKILILLCTSG